MYPIRPDQPRTKPCEAYRPAHHLDPLLGRIIAAVSRAAQYRRGGIRQGFFPHSATGVAQAPPPPPESPCPPRSPGRRARAG